VKRNKNLRRKEKARRIQEERERIRKEKAANSCIRTVQQFTEDRADTGDPITKTHEPISKERWKSIMARMQSCKQNPMRAKNNSRSTPGNKSKLVKSNLTLIRNKWGYIQLGLPARADKPTRKRGLIRTPIRGDQKLTLEDSSEAETPQ
jgi:hypothetical protein